MTDQPERDPLEVLKVAMEPINNTLHPDVLPYLWGHGSIKDSLEPIRDAMATAIKAWAAERERYASLAKVSDSVATNYEVNRVELAELRERYAKLEALRAGDGEILREVNKRYAKLEAEVARRKVFQCSCGKVTFLTTEEPQ